MIAAPPPGVVLVVHRGDDAPALAPAEAALVADAAPVRRAEFARGRAAAHAALRALGHDRPVLARAPSRAPVWPPEVVGSITHCAGLAAAAVAAAATHRALGVDAEPNQPLPVEVAPTVLVDAERAWLAAAPPAAVAWDRLLFSIKESVYKAWHPRTARWLDFTDVTVALAPATATFVATLPDASTLHGAYGFDAAHLLSLAWLDA